ncbi:MAG: hypothetical protein IT438_09760 [Phycisphaerales bacterium]|nr:hypothetical protein [Phycisphaerales bacterium]
MTSTLRRFPDNPNLRRAGVAKGCLIAAAIFLVLLIGAGVFVAVKWKGWAAGALVSATTQMVNDSDLPADQKTRVISKVQTLADDFKSGKVSVEQMAHVFEQLGDSPLLPMGVIFGMTKGYIEPNKDLSADEKTAAKRTLQRFARGVTEKKIQMQTIQSVAAPISEPNVANKPGQFRLKQPDKVTTDQLKQFIANAKAEADKASIPDEAFDLNIADEIGKVIDEGLKKPS